MSDQGERQKSDARKGAQDAGQILEQSAKSLQDNLTKSAPVAAANYTLVGGIILLGGLGYWADRRFGTWPWLLLGGLLCGMVVGFYEIVKSVRH